MRYIPFVVIAALVLSACAPQYPFESVGYYGQVESEPFRDTSDCLEWVKKQQALTKELGLVDGFYEHWKCMETCRQVDGSVYKYSCKRTAFES